MTDSKEIAKPLTIREEQVARLHCDGLSEKAIGEQLGISQQAVHEHLSKVVVQAAVKSIREMAANDDCLTKAERRAGIARRVRNPHIRDGDYAKLVELDAKLAGELINKVDSTVHVLEGDTNRERLGEIAHQAQLSYDKMALPAPVGAVTEGEYRLLDALPTATPVDTATAQPVESIDVGNRLPTDSVASDNRP